MTSKWLQLGYRMTNATILQVISRVSILLASLVLAKASVRLD